MGWFEKGLRAFTNQRIQRSFCQLFLSPLRFKKWNQCGVPLLASEINRAFS